MSDSTPPTVLIAGAGALGCVFGGFLARAGLNVTLLGRPATVRAVNAHGLTLTGLWGQHQVTGLGAVDDAATLSGPFDWVLMPVKSWHTRAMAETILPLVKDDGIALSLQNGLGNVEQLEQVVGPERAAGARVIFGAEVTAPGRVAVTVYAAPVLIGSLDPPSPALDKRLEQVVAALGRTPIPTRRTGRLGAALWAKVFYNAQLNPLGALLGVPYGELAQNTDTRGVMDRVLDEAFAVARAEGVDLDWDHAAGYRELFYRELVPATARHRSSMLQDLEAGRPTEVDAINGEICRRGRTHGIGTPVGDTLVAMIRFMAAKGAAKGREPSP